MNEEGLTTIIHRDRHGTVKNTREFSVPLTSELGDSETLAMSQKGVSDIISNISAIIEEMGQAIEDGGSDSSAAINGLQNQINAIVADKATVSLTASPSVVFIGEQTNISLTASCNPAATAITIKKGNTVLNSSTETRTSLNAAENNITPSGDITYSAEFIIAGVTKSVTRKVSAVHPIYVGAGATAEAATRYPTAKTSPNGTYTVNLVTSGHQIWFVVPDNMSINKATMNGYDFYFKTPVTITKNGVSYMAYESDTDNGFVPGTYQIVIS